MVTRACKMGRGIGSYHVVPVAICPGRRVNAPDGCSPVLRQQGWVNVHQLSQKFVDKDWRQNPHKAREDNHIRLCRGHFFCQSSIKCLARLEFFVIDNRRRDTSFTCSNNPLSSRAITDNLYDGAVE